MTRFFFSLYQRVVLDHPRLWLVLITVITVLAAIQARDFRLDASADSLVLENDEALAFYREMAKRYGGSEFLVITYEPEQPLFSRPAIDRLTQLHNELAALERVESVQSMLDVPLLLSPKVEFSDLASGYRTVADEGVDLALAREEFTGANPVYRDLLVNRDGKITALLVNFKRDEKYYRLLNERADLREKRRAGDLTAAEAQRLDDVTREFSDYNTAQQSRLADEIAAIRSIMDNYRDDARLFLGGAPMIASDVIDFVRKDLSVFGIGVTLFLILTLVILFRRLRWVLVPMLCCGITVIWMLGWLALVDWKVTVISSNFVSLLLIITMSIAIHLTVRYREAHARQPDATSAELVHETVSFMARPVFYTTITTMVAFASLMFSGIRPLIDFGWMMTIGIGVAMVLCFILYPALLSPLPAGKPQKLRDFTRRTTLAIATFTTRFAKPLVITSVVLTLVTLYGVTRLTVENRFIDYFQEDTEIFQGMLEIDRNLGGTTPLDIIIDAPKSTSRGVIEDDGFADWDNAPDDPMDDPFGDPFDDPFGDPFASASTPDPLENSYWFTPERLALLLDIQHYLESLPETGKVLSIASTYEIATILNDGPLNYVELMLLASFVPPELRAQLVRPYLSEDGNQVRISVRVIDSDHNLERKTLLAKITDDLVSQFGLAPEQIHLTGAMVLYNNMLQSLFKSQANTLGFVFLAIMLMFLALFRSFALAIIAMLPNLFSAGLVLGLMGWMGLPLDLMTITIAAITIGIAVDDSIHYIHRFREEFPQDQDYVATLRRCHGSIGTAMYYTSVVVIAGFSILAISNFNPTVYFGLLASLAMLVALLSNLTLLPAMLVWLKPRIPPLAQS